MTAPEATTDTAIEPLLARIEERCAMLRSEYIRLFNRYGGNNLATKKCNASWCQAEEDALECQRLMAKYGFTDKTH